MKCDLENTQREREELRGDLERFRASVTKVTELQNRLDGMDTQLKQSETGLANVSAKNSTLEEECRGLKAKLEESHQSKVIIYYIFSGMD